MRRQSLELNFLFIYCWVSFNCKECNTNYFFPSTHMCTYIYRVPLTITGIYRIELSTFASNQCSHDCKILWDVQPFTAIQLLCLLVVVFIETGISQAKAMSRLWCNVVEGCRLPQTTHGTDGHFCSLPLLQKFLLQF